MSGPGIRLAREQARRGILRIAEPRHPTAASGRQGLMGVRMGCGEIDLLAIATRGAWVGGELGLNMSARATAGRLLGM